MKTLILGGTTEARLLAGELKARGDMDVVLSLAGRTANPIAQGVATRIGGFGGAEGLANYLRAENISRLIDATHPYAAQISENAHRAAQRTGTPFIALRRPPWMQHPDDRWVFAPTVQDAVAALGSEPVRAFLTLGRNDIRPFESAPQHAYLIRSVDPIDPPLAVPDATYLTARGPFQSRDELALLKRHRIGAVVSKNSGGDASYGKIAAARALKIPVVMIERPRLPDAPSVWSIPEVLSWCDHALTASTRRGV
ncbi:MAG: cobalt-precorrin-6A reductase [Pseudomonadota bacterium]